MDILSSGTIDATEGLTYIAMSGLGAISALGGVISLAQIIKVSRQGVQHDRVGIGNINDGNSRQWAWQSSLKRLHFPAVLPFGPNEQVHIIFKTTV
jgi:hypothetical protein